MPDTGIATRLRAAGLDVREVKGWKTRGRDFAGASPAFHPIGGVNHHTAGQPSKANPTPSLGIIIHGRSDLAGPLANFYLGFDRKFYVIAAGVANHAGLPDGGSIKGMTGNSTAYGLEIEHNGISLLPKDMVDLAARGWAAVLRGTGIAPTQVVQHREWAPSRKNDAAVQFRNGSDPPFPSANQFRHMIAVELKELNTVKKWTVSFKNGKGERLTGDDAPLTGDPEAWVHQHPGALQRGYVKFTPKRR